MMLVVSRTLPVCTVSHTAAGLNYRLISTTVCRNDDMFIAIYYYWTRYWLGQSRQQSVTESVWFVILCIVLSWSACMSLQPCSGNIISRVQSLQPTL